MEDPIKLPNTRDDAIALLRTRWLQDPSFTDFLYLCSKEDCLILIQIFFENPHYDMPIYLHFGFSMLFLLNQLSGLADREHLDHLQKDWRDLYMNSYFDLADFFQREKTRQDLTFTNPFLEKWNVFFGKLKNIQLNVPIGLNRRARKKYLVEPNSKKNEILNKWKSRQDTLMRFFEIGNAFSYLCQPFVHAQENQCFKITREEGEVFFWELGDLFSEGLNRLIQNRDQAKSKSLKKSISEYKLQDFTNKSKELIKDWGDLRELSEDAYNLMNAQVGCRFENGELFLETSCDHSLEKIVNQAKSHYSISKRKFKEYFSPENEIKISPQLSLRHRPFYDTLKVSMKINLLILQLNSAFLVQFLTTFDSRQIVQHFKEMVTIICDLIEKENALDDLEPLQKNLFTEDCLISDEELSKISNWKNMKDDFIEFTRPILINQCEIASERVKQVERGSCVFNAEAYTSDFLYQKEELQKVFNKITKMLDYLKQDLPVDQLERAQKDSACFDSLRWFLWLTILEFEIKSLLNGSVMEMDDIFEGPILDKLEENSPFFVNEAKKEALPEEKKEILIGSIKKAELKGSDSRLKGKTAEASYEIFPKQEDPLLKEGESSFKEEEILPKPEESLKKAKSGPPSSLKKKKIKSKQKPLTTSSSSHPALQKIAYSEDTQKSEEETFRFPRNIKRRKVEQILRAMGLTKTGLGKGSHELLSNSDRSEQILLSHRKNLPEGIRALLNRQLKAFESSRYTNSVA